MIRRLYLMFLLFSFLAFCFAGCAKTKESDISRNMITTGLAFQSDSGANSMVLGIYWLMGTTLEFEARTFTCYLAGAADELVSNFEIDDIRQFEKNMLLPDNGVVKGLWSGNYQTIMQINTCIEGLQQSKTLSPETKKRLLAEVKFCRAFEYFYLLNLWGDVPMLTSSDWKINRVVARTEKSKIYDFIVSDLNEALVLMDEYPTVIDKLRPGKDAVHALLARIYLYKEDWMNAESAASLLINSGNYTPLPSLDQSFLKNSHETIWQLINDVPFGATWEGMIFLTPKYYGVPPFRLTTSFLNSIESGDPRGDHWIKIFNVDSRLYRVPFKYKDAGYYGNREIKEYQVVFRMAEQYLIRAEARAKQQNIAGAVSDLNIIRKRARGTNTADILPDLPVTLSQKDCLLAIEQERRVELFCEWGHRWLDLKRTNRADFILGNAKPGWNTNKQWFPIPQSEISANPNLSQNKGY